MIEALTALILAFAPATQQAEGLAQLYLDATHDAPVDVLTLVAVSYHESRLRSGLVSRTGACGIMQVQPKFSRWSCADMAHDAAGIAAGIEALRGWNGSLAHYGGGNRGSMRYQRTVLRYRESMQAWLVNYFADSSPP